jgi:hypothetical protein
MKKNLISRLVLVTLVSLLGVSAMAQTAMERLKQDYPAVMEQYGKNLQDLKIHYIFVVDVSGTMNEYRDKVVIPGVREFLETLPEDDYASIIAFGGNADVMCTPLKMNPENRKMLINKLYESYDFANRLNSGRTYVDVAASKVIDVVEKDTVSDICFAVFFSDLCDHHTNWSFKDRVSKLKDKPFGVVATAFPAKYESQRIQQQNGIRCMENTFPGFSYSSNIKDVFGEKLENFKHDIYIPELKLIVQNELAKVFEGLKLNTKLHINKQVRFHADFNKNTPAFIKGITVDTVWLTDQSPEISSVKFVANPRIPRFKKSCKLGRVVFAEKGKIFHHDPYLSMGLVYHLDTPEPKTEKDPSFERDLVNLEIAESLYDISVQDAKAKWVIGWPFWLFCVVAMAVLAYGLLFIFNTLLPHKVRGKILAVKDALTDSITTYTLPAKHSFTIGNDQCDCKLSGASFILKATYRNGSPLNLLWKRRLSLHLDPQSSGVELFQNDVKKKSVSIHKKKEAIVVQNITTRLCLKLS